MNYENRYKDVLERAKKELDACGSRDCDAVRQIFRLFPELKESEDERIRKALIELVKFSKTSCFELLKDQSFNVVSMDAMLAWLEKRGETPKGKTAVEAWKDMRLEVYQQASGNRHEPNYSDDTTKMFSLNDIDEIFEKITSE